MENPKLKELLSLGKPVGFLDDVSDTGMPPVLIILEINPNAKLSEWGIREEFGFMLWDEPLVQVYDLSGEVVWKGVLQPADRDLIIKFSANHFFSVLSGTPF